MLQLFFVGGIERNEGSLILLTLRLAHYGKKKKKAMKLATVLAA